MNHTERIKEIAELVNQQFNGFCTWDEPLIVNGEFDFELCRLYGAAGNLYTAKDVWLLNNDGDWYQLTETDRNFEYVANSVIQRLQNLRILKHVRYNKAELWKR